MDDDSSFEDDITPFDDTAALNNEEEQPKPVVKKKFDSPFEILTMEKMLQTVEDQVQNVRSFTEVRPIFLSLNSYMFYQ